MPSLRAASLLPCSVHIIIVLLLLLAASTAHGAPPPDRIASLRHGIALTSWFRFPASTEPAALRNWISDDAIAALHRAGFGFVRLAVDPAVLSAPGVLPVLADAIGRLQRQGLAVVVSLHPNGWHLEDDPADQVRLFAAWRILAPLLGPFDPRLTVAELLNEPVFPHDAAAWQRLQHRLLVELRHTLPATTVLLTGNDWSSVDGLLAMQAEPDPNVLYGVHLYDPVELTSLAAWRQGLDRAALARLPFPGGEEAACRAAGGRTDTETAGVIGFYCAQHWDAARLVAKLEAAAAWGRRTRTPVLLGEFGASAALNRSARLAWLNDVRRAAEAAGMGWTLWGYDDVMGLNLRRPPGHGQPLDPAILQALGLHPGW
jgi:endoglucanase